MKTTKTIKVFQMVLSMKAGGLERIVHELASRLSGDGMEIHVGCLNEGGVLLNDLASRGIPTVVFGKRPVPVDLGLVRRLRRYFRDQGITVLHSHSTGCMLYGALAAAANRGVGMVHTDHGRCLPDSFTVFLEERIACRACQRVVAVSHPLARYLEAEVGIPRRKIEVVINGVDLDRFHPAGPGSTARRSFMQFCGWAEDDIVLGLTARFDPVKNIPWLIRAFARLAHGNPRVRLLLVGDGPDGDAIRALVAELALETRVRLEPWRENIEEMYRFMDILTLCSQSEGTSLTILEAMATGLPVVASRVGGNPEIVADGRSGSLFHPDSEADFLGALAPLLDRPEMRRAMGQFGRELAEAEFGLPAMVSTYAELYRKMANRKGGRRT